MYLVKKVVKNGILPEAEAGAIRQARCSKLNRSALKLGVLTMAIYAIIYGASTRGEPGSTVDFLLIPLAFVSTVALVKTIVSRVRLTFAPRG